MVLINHLDLDLVLHCIECACVECTCRLCAC